MLAVGAAVIVQVNLEILHVRSALVAQDVKPNLMQDSRLASSV